MEPFAEPGDIVAVFRPLTPTEETLATGLLAQASLKLRLAARKRGIDMATLMLDELTAEAVKTAVVNAAKRVLMNPEAVRQWSETTGPMSESRTIDAAISSGALYLADGDLADIFPPVKPSRMQSFRVRAGLS
jgi:hypothetical protein